MHTHPIQPFEKRGELGVVGMCGEQQSLEARDIVRQLVER
jgi:hypothetical protein